MSSYKTKGINIEDTKDMSYVDSSGSKTMQHSFGHQ